MTPAVPPLDARALCALLLVVLLLPGCFLNFDEFRDVDPGDMGTDAAMSDTGIDMSDASDSDMIIDPDFGDPDMAMPHGIGANCDDDDQCGEMGRCFDGYCTRDCVAGGCPAGSHCATVGGEDVCVADCTAESECAVADSSGLSCVPVSSLEGGEAANACLPDADEDTVSDFDDNCPDDFNTMQVDADVDGQGDVCDDEPTCPDGATDGVLDLGAHDYPATNFALPSLFDTTWAPIIGGLDEMGAATTALSGAFLSSTMIEVVGMFPYASLNHGIASLGDGDFLVTPGALSPGAGQFGRTLVLDADGTTTPGPGLDRLVYEPVIAFTGTGELVMLAYIDSDMAVDNRWRIYHYDPSEQRFNQLSGVGDNFGRRVRWYVARDAVGQLHFYSEAIGPSIPGRVVSITPDVSTTAERTIPYPPGGANSSQPFEPAIVPGRGGIFWVFERASGRAYSLELATRNIKAVPDLDLVVESATAFASRPRGTSFMRVSRSAADAAMIEAEMVFLACVPGALGLDSDVDMNGMPAADGVSDVRDNCPFTPNPDQSDIDGDLIGDACDPDIDGDGIPNVSDFVVDENGNDVPRDRDLDGDGLDNDVDDDDDGDGIPDATDPFPFDTDNDGLRNEFDDDDDGDGYPDSVEGNDGAATNPLSFPGAGKIVFVTESSSGRTLNILSLGDDQGSVLQRRGGGEPHLPRFGSQGQNVIVLDGPPETATAVEWVPLDGMNLSDPIDLTQRLRGAAVAQQVGADLIELVVTQTRADDDTKWEIARVTLTSNMVEATNPVVTALDDLSAPDFGGETIAFVGGPIGCASCRAAYLTAPGGGPLNLVAPSVTDPERIRYNGTVALVAEASDGNGTSAWVRRGTTTEEFRPPGTTRVESVATFQDERHLVVAAAEDNGTLNLWFYNGRTDAWLPLKTSPDDLREVDWAP